MHPRLPRARDPVRHRPTLGHPLRQPSLRLPSDASGFSWYARPTATGTAGQVVHLLRPQSARSVASPKGLSTLELSSVRSRSDVTDELSWKESSTVQLSELS